MTEPQTIRLSGAGIDQTLRRTTRLPPSGGHDPLAVALGDVVVRARRRARLSQNQLADRLQLDRSAISRWEAGKRFPTLPHLVRFAELTGTTASHLLAEAETVMREMATHRPEDDHVAAD